MMLKYVLGSALAAAAAAHSGSFSSYVPAGLCSGPCPAQFKEALALVQRHASTLPSLDVDVNNESYDQQNTEMAMKDFEIQKRIEDKHTAIRGIAKSEEKHKKKQDIGKLEKDIAKQKDLVNKEIEDKHEAKQFIVKLEEELAEQKSEEKDYAQASSLQRSYQAAPSFTVMSGPCIASGLCVQSPNYPANYGNNQGCNINVEVGVEITVEAFDIYDYNDYLTVNGVGHNGRDPYIGGTTTQSNIVWSSNKTPENKGWKICEASTSSPTGSPTGSPTPASTSSPTGSPTGSPTLAIPAPSASGDPHLTNIRGDKFDIHGYGGVQ